MPVLILCFKLYSPTHLYSFGSPNIFLSFWSPQPLLLPTGFFCEKYKHCVNANTVRLENSKKIQTILRCFMVKFFFFISLSVLFNLAIFHIFFHDMKPFQEYGKFFIGQYTNDHEFSLGIVNPWNTSAIGPPIK